MIELLSSMRFAISLLTVICIASVIGTVLKQNEPTNNYINQFGPFWAELFATLKLNAVYSAWWFLLILAFLVISTSLCIARNAPKILVDLKNYKENIREQSLKAFHHKAEGHLNEAPEAAAKRLGALLATGGWKVKLQERDTPAGKGWMLAAKAGAANKIGYIAAHSAIVLVCVGGLLDGDLAVRAQMWFGGKEIYNGGGLIADVPAQHRLSERNPAFRANLLVAEDTASGTAILNQSNGILLQELPFVIELKSSSSSITRPACPSCLPATSSSTTRPRAKSARHVLRSTTRPPSRASTSTSPALTTGAHRSLCKPCRWQQPPRLLRWRAPLAAAPT